MLEMAAMNGNEGGHGILDGGTGENGIGFIKERGRTHTGTEPYAAGLRMRCLGGSCSNAGITCGNPVPEIRLCDCGTAGGRKEKK